MSDKKEEVKYYTYQEAAQLLRCSESTIRNRVKSGEIQPLRNGRLVLFTMECLEKFLNKQQGAVS